MKRTLTPWLKEYLQDSDGKYKDEWELEIYRDERESVIPKLPLVEEERNHLFFETVVRPTVLFREVFPNFLLATQLFQEGDLVRHLQGIYLSLFWDYFQRLRIPKSSPFYRGGYELAGFTENHWLPDIMIECSKCQKSVSLCNNNGAEDNLYRSTEWDQLNDEEVAASKYGYCGISKKFLCLSCEEVLVCRECGGTMGESHRIESSMKCTQCLHALRPQRKKHCCNTGHQNFTERVKYTRLYQCSGACNRVVCNLDSIHLQNTQWTLCLKCLNGAMQNGFFFENEQFQKTLFEVGIGGEERYGNDFGVYLEESRRHATTFITDTEAYVEIVKRFRK